jgi:hypothetical protein
MSTETVSVSPSRRNAETRNAKVNMLTPIILPATVITEPERISSNIQKTAVLRTYHAERQTVNL